MSAQVPEQTTGQKIGGVLFGVAAVFCSMEMIPGWGIFHLDWPHETFYSIMAVCGAISGFLLAPRNRLPGLAGGLVAGPGCLFATALLLEWTTWTHTVILAIVGMIGCLPGLGVYRGLKALQDAFLPPEAELVEEREGSEPEASG
jgi:hypothetical protein